MKKRTEFSKLLLIQESVLIWIITLFCLLLSAFCIYRGYTGSLGWLSTIISVSWGAYGVSQTMYYQKSKAENTQGGIKYDVTLKQLESEEEIENPDDYQI